jgi:hypothetical protein
MATTTNYGWTTPDDTSLVKDGASAIRTLGSSIDTTTKNLNPSTTLGDIEYRSSTANTNTRLGIGTTNQVLTVSGGVPAWITPAGAVTNYTLLNTGGTALTGATTVTVSGISGIQKLWIYIKGASAANNYSYITVRLNGDTASNYQTIAQQFDTGAAYFIPFDDLNASIYVGRIGVASTTGAGIVSVDGCNSSGFKIFQGNGSFSETSYNTRGYYNSSSVISSVSVVSSSGNLDAGTVYVYGSSN